jgi:DNA invertase Pin-like site-specific DNA recombinase
MKITKTNIHAYFSITARESYRIQEFEMRSWIKSLPHVELGEEFVDLTKNKSFKHLKRLSELIHSLNDVEGICIYNFQSMTHNLELTTKLLIKMKEFNLPLYVVSSKQIFASQSERNIFLTSLILHVERNKKQNYSMGLLRAKKEGTRIGRPPKPIDFKKFDKLYSKHTLKECADRLNVSYCTLYRRRKKREVESQ